MKTGVLNTSYHLPWCVEYEGNKGKEVDYSYLLSWYRDNQQLLDEKLPEHGAILFRGFGINTPSAFARLTKSLATSLAESMEENVPRTKLTSGIYTSTEYPAEYMLSMHSEYSYSHRWPARLFFCCITAAREGGETPIADNREILRELDDEIVQKFTEKRVKYLRNLHNGEGFGLSWQKAFQTTDRAVVEQYCRDTNVDFQWRENDNLHLSQIMDGVITHPKTQQRVWFNQAPQFHPSDYPLPIYQSLVSVYKDEEDLPQNVCFGDDTPMDAAMLEKIRTTMRERAACFPWQEGDLLMVDNVLASHGRMPFVGPRKILVAMSEN
jgi:alpha-ketoglutarate-dependent taurine dioxygenase